MKYLNQLEYPHIPYITRTSQEPELRERGSKTTVRSAGCGLCSAVMVAHRLLPETDFSLEDAIRISYATEANYRAGTAYSRFAPAFAEEMGLKVEQTDDMQRLLECLRTGGAAVLHVGGDREGYVGLFSHGGHYITAINAEPDGRIAILDPSFKEGKFDEEGREGKVEIRNKVVLLCRPEYVAEDCASKENPYALFWRA